MIRIYMNRISDVYVTSSSTIVLVFSTLEFLIWTKPGDGSWEYAGFNIYGYTNALFYNDRILVYDPDWRCGVVQINFANEMPSQPQVEVVIPDPEGSLADARYLIDCNGNLYIVLSPTNDHDAYSFDMHKLDLNMKTCVPSTNLGDYSIFVNERTFSVSCKNRLVPANCIYFCGKYNGENAMYNYLSTNIPRSLFLNPNPFVKKLINFCLRPTPENFKTVSGHFSG